LTDPGFILPNRIGPKATRLSFSTFSPTASNILRISRFRPSSRITSSQLLVSVLRRWRHSLNRAGRFPSGTPRSSFFMAQSGILPWILTS